MVTGMKLRSSGAVDSPSPDSVHGHQSKKTSDAVAKANEEAAPPRPTRSCQVKENKSQSRPKKKRAARGPGASKRKKVKVPQVPTAPVAETMNPDDYSYSDDSSTVSPKPEQKKVTKYRQKDVENARLHDMNDVDAWKESIRKWYKVSIDRVKGKNGKKGNKPTKTENSTRKAYLQLVAHILAYREKPGTRERLSTDARREFFLRNCHFLLDGLLDSDGEPVQYRDDELGYTVGSSMSNLITAKYNKGLYYREDIVKKGTAYTERRLWYKYAPILESMGIVAKPDEE